MFAGIDCGAEVDYAITLYERDAYNCLCVCHSAQNMMAPTPSATCTHLFLYMCGKKEKKHLN